LTKKQMLKSLQMIHKDLAKVETRMQKIADKLGIDRHEFLEKTLWEVETLLEMFEGSNKPMDN
jgi:hypothetical protein